MGSAFWASQSFCHRSPVTQSSSSSSSYTSIQRPNTMCGVGGGAAGLFKGVAHLERCHCARGGMIREINASLHRAINRDRARPCTGTPSILNVQRRDAGANIFLSSLRCCQSCSHFYSSAQKNTRFRVSGTRTFKTVQVQNSLPDRSGRAAITHDSPLVLRSLTVNPC